jgi:feruloyl-CoA synthase
VPSDPRDVGAECLGQLIRTGLEASFIIEEDEIQPRERLRHHLVVHATAHYRRKTLVQRSGERDFTQRHVGGDRIRADNEHHGVCPSDQRLDAAHDAIGPDTIAKFLLTSGSTGNPKAVINTQRMICANQVMLRETLAFLMDEPPVIVDWLPWNHTFGGNHNIGLTLFNGGSMYLDEGKPMPGGIEETVRNLQEISPTVYFNVPKGYESLLPYLRDDGALRKKFFARLHAMFFSGAALSAFVWNSLDELSVRETGYRVPMLTGLGATETAPFFMSVRPDTSRSGHVGLPVSGNDAKLIPNNGKLEVRAKGPNVTPGYWRQPDMTAKAFDEEGFYKMGDAIKPSDPDNFDAGFDFDGRTGEDVTANLKQLWSVPLKLAGDSPPKGRVSVRGKILR